MIRLGSRARRYFGAIVLLTALLVAGGVYSATRMPSAIYPEVSFPRIAIVARVPGLGLVNTEVQVTRPLEQAVREVEGVVRVRSKTIRGSAQLSVDFVPGTDMLRAEQFTWNRIASARSNLPADVDLAVHRLTPSAFPIMSLVLTGGSDLGDLRDYAYYELAPRLKNIPDVRYANVAGGDLREIEVLVRPTDLLAAGLSAADLADRIGKEHLRMPVGVIERPPYGFEVLVDTQGHTVQRLEDLVLATHEGPYGGQSLRVRDVADVRLGREDRKLSVGYGGREAVVISIFRNVNGNVVGISDAVHAELQRRPPPGNIEARIVYDQATFVTTSVHNVRDAIVVGGVFSVFILLLFLRSWRATALSALAIPTSMAIAMLILHAFGRSLNLMSLGGLAVAIGLIIDDTVVVIENIARHLTVDRRGAAVEPVDAATSEITSAVIGSTLTTVLVFLPLAFIAGVYGQFFAALSWSLTAAVLTSLVISLTLIPMLAAKFLAQHPMPEPGRLYRWLADRYERGLALALRHHWLSLAASLAAVGVIFVLLIGISAPGRAPEGEKAYLVEPIKTGLMPEMDEGAFVFDYTAPTGTPLDGTVALARQVEEVLLENPDVDAYVRRSGAELGIYATETNRGDIQVVLRPAPENPLALLREPVRPEFSQIVDEMKRLGRQEAKRKYGPHFTAAQALEEGKQAIRRRYRRRSAPEVMDEVETEVRKRFSAHQLDIDTTQIMQDQLNDLSGAGRPIEVKLFGPKYDKLRQLAKQVAALLVAKGQPLGLRDIQSGVHRGNPDLRIRLQQAQTARLNLTAAEVERQLRAMYAGQVATQIRPSDVRILNVRVRYPNRLRFGSGLFDPRLVSNQWLLLPPQTQGPLDKVLTSPAPLAGATRAAPLFATAWLEYTRIPTDQRRENQQPVHYVEANLNAGGAGLGRAAAQIEQWLTGMSLPPGYHFAIGGNYLSQHAAFASLLLVMVVAIVLVYIMLAFQFRSVVLPFVIFLTQPLSLGSGLLALWLTGTALNVSSYMGAILLIGLDMKNGILMVEYIQQLRAQGVKLERALLEAGRTRFRPILMTSLAAILGLFPLALGIGAGAQMQQPLAIMVIGGLTANMLFTRMIIPVGYLVFQRWHLVESQPISSKLPAPQS